MQLTTGSKFNLLEIRTEDNQSLELTDWNRFPIKQEEYCKFTYSENGGFLNLVSIEDSTGQQIKVDKQIQIEKTLNLITSLQFELRKLKEVI